MDITLESIAKKMGCDDPFNPPRPEHDDPFLIDDATPSPYAILSSEERHFLYEITKKMIIDGEY